MAEMSDPDGTIVREAIRIPNGSDHDSGFRLRPGEAGEASGSCAAFLDRANAGDVDGVVALYETGAVLAFPSGETAIGTKAIREVYEAFLAHRPKLTSEGQSAPLVNGDVALTSSRLPGPGATAEIARSVAGRQLAVGR
ncbi:MAG: YybH family protein [Streptosporangiaceae bacterium]